MDDNKFGLGPHESAPYHDFNVGAILIFIATAGQAELDPEVELIADPVEVRRVRVSRYAYDPLRSKTS
jgi:hypothetical protein